MSREIIAILRGVTPTEAVEVAFTLLDEGIDRIEVPLNSPEPFQSIEKMIDAVGDRAKIGAGTVLDVPSVEKLADLQAHMVVSPDTNASVIVATKQLNMLSYPGVMTPSECFAALHAGADGLKLFPAMLLGVKGFKAIRTVLPEGTKTYAVGGIGCDGFAEWLAAGGTGFGIGSALYKPNMTTKEVGARAEKIVKAYDKEQYAGL